MAENIKWGGSLAFPRSSLFGISVISTQPFHLVQRLLFSSARPVFSYLFLCFTISSFLLMSAVYFIYSSFLFDLYFSAQSARHLSPGCEPPPWTALRISPLHALPIALSPLFPALFSPELVRTSITHMQYLFAVTPLGTRTNTVAHTMKPTPAHPRTSSLFLHQITALFSLQSPFFPPRDQGLTSWKSHQRCIALNNS